MGCGDFDDRPEPRDIWDQSSANETPAPDSKESPLPFTTIAVFRIVRPPYPNDPRRN